jgi:hypothetical protein
MNGGARGGGPGGGMWGVPEDDRDVVEQHGWHWIGWSMGLFMICEGMRWGIMMMMRSETSEFVYITWTMA